MIAEIRQEKLDIVKERDFRRGELLEKYLVEVLYSWDNRKFGEEYLKNLERNLKERIMLELRTIDFIYLIFLYYFYFLYIYP